MNNSLKWITLLSAIFLLSFSLLPATIPFSSTGMKSFDDWSPDKTGNEDVTAKLQEAVNWGITNSITIYIAPGTYKVSDRILGLVTPGNDCGSHDGKKVLNIYGDQYNRPVIKLADHSPGYGNTTIGGVKPVIEVQQQKKNAENCLFWSTIRNLDFDLGKGNYGAAAVSFAAAQDCELSGIKVYAQDTYAAGFIGVPGRNAIVANLEVIGGKYGLYLKSNSTGFTLTGIRCINQSVGGIYFNSWRSGSIIGLEILGSEGFGISAEGADVVAGQLALTDALIDISNPEQFAIVLSSRAVLLRDVYVKGTKKIVTNGSKTLISDSLLTHISTYSYTPETMNGVSAYSYINGTRHTTLEVKDLKNVGYVPANVVKKNLPVELYAFNHPEAVSVTDFGAIANDNNDDYTAFATAIATSRVVFVPAGTYNLSAPVELRSNTVIFGDPGKKSRLKPVNQPTERTWVLVTPDMKGYVSIHDLAFDVPDESYFGAIKWQTSDGFIYNVRNYLSSGHLELNKHNYEFTGNAGGKFYGISEHNNFALYKVPPGQTPSAHPDFRKVYIEGTSNPLIFYGLNLERGGGARNEVMQYPFFEAVNAQNIRVNGSKAETDGPVYRLSNVKNFMLTSLLGTQRINGKTVLHIDAASDNIEMAMLYIPDKTGLLLEGQSGDAIFKNTFVGHYQKGSFNLDVFSDDAIKDHLLVHAGNNQTITLPENSAIFEASVMGTGNVNWAQWEKIAGPQITMGDVNTTMLTLSGAQNGVYHFKVTVRDDHGNLSAAYVTLTVNPNPSGTKREELAGKISLIPNPARQSSMLYLPAGSDVMITNALGQNVLFANNIKDEAIEINKEMIGEGFFYIKIQMGNVWATKKLVLL